MIVKRPLPSSNGRGFTLIEMLVVLAVAALIATLAFPDIARSIGLAEYRTTQTEIAAKLAEARAIALRTDARQDFIVDAGQREFRIAGQEAQEIPEGIAIEQTAVISFFADGTAKGTEIRLTWRGRTTRMQVEPETGLVRRAV